MGEFTRRLSVTGYPPGGVRFCRGYGTPAAVVILGDEQVENGLVVGVWLGANSSDCLLKRCAGFLMGLALLAAEPPAS